MNILSAPDKGPAPLLCNGDRISQPEFHRRYQASPEDVKFELVGGVVYMASPLKRPHGSYHSKLCFALELYCEATPGVESTIETTTILGEESEPQPDLSLRILSEYGGQARLDEEEYVVGPPELLAEVAHSTRAMAMNQKRQDYEQAGVREYLVLCVEEQELRWFDFAAGDEIRANRQGVWRSRVFPGLWLDGAALLARDGPGLGRVMRQGRASREHAAFVKRLERARSRRERGGGNP
jgi:Uma2 family endonuclease